MMAERTLGLRRESTVRQPSAQANVRPMGMPRSSYDSLARQPEMFEVAPAQPAAPVQPQQAQGVLFTAHEVRQGEAFRTKVVSLDDYRQTTTKTRRRSAPRTRPAGRALPPYDAEAQQTLFSELIDEPAVNAAATLPECGLRCDSMVAPLAQRVTATVLDFVMVCLAEGLLFLALYVSPASAFISSRTLPGLAVFGLFLAFGYKMMFALAETDSPGTRWTHLKILNFDGVEPTRGERLARLAGGVLSTSAAALGLIWALVDEETLSWHDHISKTFASPRDQ